MGAIRQGQKEGEEGKGIKSTGARCDLSGGFRETVSRKRQEAKGQRQKADSKPCCCEL